MKRTTTQGSARRRLAGLVSSAVLASSGLAVLGAAAAPTAGAAVACRVSYSVASQWPGGFVANVAIENLGDPLSGWTVSWSFSGDQRVTSAWNARVSQSGSQVSAANEGYNGSLGSGASTSFGFQGTYGSSNPVPGSFSINGTPCTGSGGGTSSSSTATSTSSATSTQTTASTTSTSSSTSWSSSSSTSSQGNGSCGSGSFDAEVVRSGGSWVARNGGRQVYAGGDMLSAMQAAVNSLSSGRSWKQSVVVRDSGEVPASQRLSLPSYTRLEVCGTINVTGSGSGDMAPVYSRGTHDVEVSYLRVTGTPLYGMFFRNVDNLTLGQIDMRVSSGLGVRIDNHGNRSVKSRNVRIDDVYVSGTSSHGVETYGVDGLTIGTVTARNTGYSGLLLNDTINASVGTVDAEGAGTGTGYAAFRMANRNGRVWDSYPTNIRVGTVRARGGGRGVFCVSESGGAVIDRVDIANTGNNPILIENCYNVNIAAQSGLINGGEVRLAARSEFPGNRDITLQNLTLSGGAWIRESPCTSNLTIRNVNGGSINRC